MNEIMNNEASDVKLKNNMCADKADLVKENSGMRKNGMGRALTKVRDLAMNKEEGLDGILVTIGLCIIALLLCVVMRDSLTTFIQTIVTEMTNSARNILATAGALIVPGVTL